MDGSFSVFGGEWRCENRYIHQNYMPEPVDGTQYEHTLRICSNGKYRIIFPEGRNKKGRIKKIIHDDGGQYQFEFTPNFLTSSIVFGNGGWFKVFLVNDYLTIYTDGVEDFHYVKIN